MKKYIFNKLIRSKIPARMQEEGIMVNAQELNDEEYVVKLKEKIVEEAREVVNANSKENLTIELADVIEVIYSLAEASNISKEQIEQARLKKRQINGGFDSIGYVNYIEVALDNHKMIVYLDDKDRPYIFTDE